MQYVDSPCSGIPPSTDGVVASDVHHVSELPFQNSGFDERNVESVCPSPSTVHEATEDDAPRQLGSQPTVSAEQWELGVAASFGQFAQRPSESLKVSGKSMAQPPSVAFQLLLQI